MITPTEYQPLLFHKGTEPATCDDCGECESWTQKMFESDSIPFQFSVQPCSNAVNVITNPYFLGNPVTGWTKEGNTSAVTLTGGSGAAIVTAGAGISQSISSPLTSWFMARIEIMVSSYVMDFVVGIRNDLEQFGQTEVTLSPGINVIEMPIFLGLNTFGINTISGNFYPGVSFITIQLVELMPMNIPSVTVVDMDGVTLDTLSAAALENGLLNVQYTPNQATIDAGRFAFQVSQDCDSFNETWTSEGIEIVDEDACLLQVGGCSDNNVFLGAFLPYMRIDAKLIDSGAVYERFLQRKTTGARRLIYGRMSFTFTLQTDYLPKHIRDFVYLLPMMQDVVIKKGNGAQNLYFVLEDPDAPEYKPSSDSMGRISLILTHKKELIETIYKQECNVVLPPKALGSTDLNAAIKVDTDTAINAE